MSHDTTTAWEPAIAANIEAVPKAMTAAHDALIRRWGRRRRTGISWELYGPDLAVWTARQRAPHADHMAGTLTEGLEILERLLEGSEGHEPEERTREKMANLKTYAAQHRHPTLVIAYCDIRAPRRYT